MIIKEDENEIEKSNNLGESLAEEDKAFIQTAAGISPKKKSTAILLNMILLGALGLHRFYVGKIKSGALMLGLSLISAGSIGIVWGCIDLCTLVFTDKFTDSDNRPLVGNGVVIFFEYLAAIAFICFLLYRFLK